MCALSALCVALALGLAGVSGCATAGTVVPDFGPIGPRGLALSGRTGKPLSAAEVDTLVAGARVVLVGEQHADAASHAVQRVVLEHVVALFGKERVAVGVEWLPGSASPAVASWLAGDEPVSSLGTATRWSEVWGHTLDAYAPLLLAVRALGVSLVPLNAEPGLARLVARGGRDGVPAERQAELPPLDSASEAHRAWFSDTMKELAAKHGQGAHGAQHTMDEARLERLYLAQLVWDETMARGARELAKSAPDKVVVVFAGQGHVERGLGIPARLGDLPSLVVLPVAAPAEVPPRSKDAPFPEREADLLWLAPGR